MGTSGSVGRFSAAFVAATALVVLTTGVVLAHPDSEGDHPSGCVVTAEPGTVPVGGQFTVSGNFGGASIFVLPGADASPAEDAEPDVVTPEGQDFSVTFTATGSPGEITVVALLPESECGDSDGITVTGTLPNTATDGRTDPVAGLAGLVLLGTALMFLRMRLANRRT